MIIAIVSAIFAYRANLKANEANRLAEEANKIAQDANNLALESNQIALLGTSSYISIKDDSTITNPEFYACKRGDNYVLKAYQHVNAIFTNSGGATTSLIQVGFDPTKTSFNNWSIRVGVMEMDETLDTAALKFKGLPQHIPAGTSREWYFRPSGNVVEAETYEELRDNFKNVDTLIGEQLTLRFTFSNNQSVYYYVNYPEGLINEEYILATSGDGQETPCVNLERLFP